MRHCVRTPDGWWLCGRFTDAEAAEIEGGFEQLALDLGPRGVAEDGEHEAAGALVEV